VDNASAHELNNLSQMFGMVGNDFYSYLTNDVEEQESLRLAKEQEEEKAMYSVRKWHSNQFRSCLYIPYVFRSVKAHFRAFRS